MKPLILALAMVFCLTAVFNASTAQARGHGHSHRAKTVHVKSYRKKGTTASVRAHTRSAPRR